MLARIYRYDTQDGRTPVCSLIPEPEGLDDGGRDYVLPEGYRLEEDAIIGQAGPCSLQLHNDAPVLVDAQRELAFLLEPDPKITHAREKAGITRQQLADSLGVPLLTVYQWEHNEVEPGTAVLGRIAAILGCETLDLI